MTEAKDIHFTPEVEQALKDIGHWKDHGKGGDGSGLVQALKEAYAGNKEQVTAVLKEIPLDVFDATDADKHRPKGQLPDKIKAALKTIGGEDGDKLVAAFSVIPKIVEQPGKVTPDEIAAKDKATIQLVTDVKHSTTVDRPAATPPTEPGTAKDGPAPGQ